MEKYPPIVEQGEYPNPHQLTVSELRKMIKDLPGHTAVVLETGEGHTHAMTTVFHKKSPKFKLHPTLVVTCLPF